MSQRFLPDELNREPAPQSHQPGQMFSFFLASRFSSSSEELPSGPRWNGHSGHQRAFFAPVKPTVSLHPCSVKEEDFFSLGEASLLLPDE